MMDELLPPVAPDPRMVLVVVSISWNRSKITLAPAMARACTLELPPAAVVEGNTGSENKNISAKLPLTEGLEKVAVQTVGVVADVEKDSVGEAALAAPAAIINPARAVKRNIEVDFIINPLK